MTQKVQAPAEQLSQLFGGYRAEWLKEQIFDLFTEPSYFPELKTPRPCVLIGGRGTGKTTVLRGLSYEGQYALTGNTPESIPSWTYYGLYHRANVNRVSAFSGAGLDTDEWIPLFAHYVNLLFCDLIVRFVDWYRLKLNVPLDLNPEAFRRLASSLRLSTVPNTFRAFGESLADARIIFEAAINNIADKPRPELSIQGGPIDVLVQELSSIPQFQDKTFFFLIDEYENFLPYQQRVINTLIKHSGELYTFKIGVKELGLKTRTTLDETQQLHHPSDYVRIDIADRLKEDQFHQFALSVCNERMARIKLENGVSLGDIQALLPGLSEDAEAELLGVQQEVDALILKLEAKGKAAQDLKKIEPLRAYLIKYWADAQGEALEETYDNFVQNPEAWRTRYSNYKHALLYHITKGKRGIRRYYAGWDVFTRLAAGNIRYLLELVDQSLLRHSRGGGQIDEPVSAKEQTLAAQGVGKKNLSELEGLSVSGAQLTKLLLGLGRVFGQMAEDSAGHAPEINEFYLSDEPMNQDIEPVQASVSNILDSAVMHLALVRRPGTKLMSEADTRDYEYAMHPIFSAYFVFSYRRKRKMMLGSHEVMGLITKHRQTIREILRRHNREEDVLPEQLQIFEAYYNAPEE